jgi:dienelactone hydrolase
VVLLAGCGATAAQPAAPRKQTSVKATASAATAEPATTTVSGGGAPVPSRPVSKPQPPFAVGQRTLTFVDSSRRLAIPGGGMRPRTLVTVIRYPHAAGRFPLIVFGHGFAVTPAIYAGLLTAWARAGYVVAAPLFPLENATAPGGPNEADIVNQPADVSFVITEMIRSSAFRRRINSREIGVTGQSDGGNTALAVGYSVHRDRRVRAAVILSGGEVPRVAELAFSPGEPPLLATQGTADTINPPSFTRAFFDLAPRPKYRLDLLGAGHLPPYTGIAPWARVTERTTTAFFDYYLKGEPTALGRMRAEGNVRGVATLEWHR